MNPDQQRPIIIRQETRPSWIQSCCGCGCLAFLILGLASACMSALGI